jgi:hypothetical protein
LQNNIDIQFAPGAPDAQTHPIADPVIIKALPQRGNRVDCLAIQGDDDIAGNDIAVPVNSGAAQTGGFRRLSGFNG